MIEVIHHDGEGALFRPRPGFARAKWPKDATFAANGFHHVPCKTPAQKAGKRYEKKVLQWISESVATDGLNFLPSPWIGFRDFTARDRLCQPDGLIIEQEAITIIEVKKVHTIDAYFQLRQLYEPVVRAMYPGKAIEVIEITASFDPRVPWPEPIGLLTSIDDRMALGGKFGVIQWRK